MYLLECLEATFHIRINAMCSSNFFIGVCRCGISSTLQEFVCEKSRKSRGVIRQEASRDYQTAYPLDVKCMQLLLRDASRAISTGRANLYARASLLAHIITAEDGRRPASCFASQECNHGRLVTGTAEVPESAG